MLTKIQIGLEKTKIIVDTIKPAEVFLNVETGVQAL
jgi:hypothetical protein